MEIIDKLIQNYYEMNGNFDRIIISDIGEYLSSIDGSLKDYCYGKLGYKSVGPVTPSKMHDLRIEYLTEPDSTLGFGTREEAEKFLTVNGMLPESFKSMKVRVSKKYEEYSKLLAAYLKNTDTIVVKFRGYTMSIRNVIQSLKVEPKFINENAKELTEQLIHSIKFSITDKKMYVYDGVFYADKKLSDKAKETIIQQSIIIATGVGIGFPQSILKSPGSLRLLAFTNNSLYLSLLEMAEIQGHTFAEALQMIGIKIVNLTPLYNHLGYIPMVCGNSTIIIGTDSNGDVRVGDTDTSSLLKSMGA